MYIESEWLCPFQYFCRQGSWILGPVKRNHLIIRANSKWWVNFFLLKHLNVPIWNNRAVRDDEIGPEVKIYPDYCNSIFYVFNVATASKIFEAAKVTQLAFVDIRLLFGFTNSTNLQIVRRQFCLGDMIFRSDIYYINHQMLIVAGGYDGSQDVASTEVMDLSGPKW